MRVQALQITGAHEKLYIVFISFLCSWLKSKSLERKELPSEVKGSFDSETNNAKIVWKYQIQGKKCRALKILHRHGNAKAVQSFLVQKTCFMFEFKCNFVDHGYSGMPTMGGQGRQLPPLPSSTGGRNGKVCPSYELFPSFLSLEGAF